MPLVTAAYLALCAGLAAGFAGYAFAAAAALTILAAVARARREPRILALTLTALVGAVVAERTRRVDAACAVDIARAAEYVVVLHDSAAPGRLVRGRVRRPCAARASLAVAAGGAGAGASVRVRGLAATTDRGVHVREARVDVVGPPAAVLQLRARAGRTIDTLFGADSAIVRALLVADASGIAPDVRDRFADAGLVHILSVSGLHVAIIAAAIELVLIAARVSHRSAAAASVVAIAGYVTLLGAPAPAVRSAVMLGAVAVTRLVQRPSSPWAAFALGGLAPLVEPRQLLDIGYQLSMAGMAALVAAGALTRRLFAAPDGPRLRGWRYVLARDLAVSVVATLVTAPIVGWHFGRVSVIGPVANVVAAPIVTLLQPMLFLALTVAPATPVAEFVADAARPLLRALDAVAAAAAEVPGATIAVVPTFAAALFAGAMAAAGVVACVARRPARPVALACACGALAIWQPLLPARAGGGVELHLLDVGQGDAIALRSPRGRWVLVDAGRVWRGGDAGRRTVIPYLRRHGGRIAAFVLSHPHADHVGGAATVLRALRPTAFVDAAFTLGSESYRGALLAARAARAEWRRVRPGESIDVDGMIVEFLAPDSAWTAALDDPNLASVVASVRYGRVRFLLVGDAEAAEERWLLDRARDDPRVADLLRADVLKVGHHGSATSSTPEFLAAVRPRVALVSVGAGNSYRHPSADVVRRLEAMGAEVLRTDRLGTVVARTDGRSLTLRARETTWNARPVASDVSRGRSPPR